MDVKLVNGSFYDTIKNQISSNRSGITISPQGFILDQRRAFFELVNPSTSTTTKTAVVEIDCSGLIISPGFIDIQLNGAFGVDFSVASSDSGVFCENVKMVEGRLPSTGVTSYCPTLVTCSARQYEQILGDFLNFTKAKAKIKTFSTSILGVHLEGPYFALEKKGAHNAKFIRTPKSTPLQVAYGQQIDSHISEGLVKIVTMAPELDGAEEVIGELVKKGVRVSMGHSMATYEEGIRGVEAGARLITHLYNAMPNFHHRSPGLVGVALGAVDRPFYSIICDGIHSHPATVKTAFTANPEGAILVTDAMSAMGLGDGEHNLGSMKVMKTGVRAVIKGTDTLAGSCVSLDYCLRKFIDFTGCSVADGLSTVTRNPAKFLGMEGEIGSLAEGRSGNIVLLDEKTLQVVKTFVGGKLVFDDCL